MKVKELTASHVRIPLRKPVKHASHERTETDNVLVRCVLDDGTEGFGEGVPREYVTGETIDSALALLQRSHLAEQLEDCSDFERAVGLAERLRLAPVAGDDRDCQGNAARCAVELALLDAYGRHFGEPISAVFHRKRRGAGTVDLAGRPLWPGRCGRDQDVTRRRVYIDLRDGRLIGHSIKSGGAGPLVR